MNRGNGGLKAKFLRELTFEQLFSEESQESVTQKVILSLKTCSIVFS
jgi:hypothetical protein